jgi:sporulation protein YlmC with PRC-barrel domain
MATENHSRLVKLGDVGETVADEKQDIRGREVIDSDGQKLGKIDALFVDEEERKIRFLQVSIGGILGVGEKKSLIPIDAITSIRGDEVRIDHTSSSVAAAPAYDPTLVEEKTGYESTYSHYGYLPFWGTGYVYPGIPYGPFRNQD